LKTYDVSIGVSTAVTMTEAATCTVAIGAMAAYVGSAMATAFGTAAELPAVRLRPQCQNRQADGRRQCILRQL
jgi:hypothetical protein